VSFTLLLAAYGAITGTAGAATAIANRRDAVWGRRARARDLRVNLEPLRDALNEAKAAPERAPAITNALTFRAHVEALGESRERCPDRKLRRLLNQLNVRCLTVINRAATVQGGQIPYALTSAIDEALNTTVAALARLEYIERRAPG